ncbi:glutamate synthase large subunit [Tenuibacillus multivorans]|uniref:Glutamate synthase (NADPH/NADH) large chain n=1 Tax=Tenuibacillus multivorans TaxID=237069 RepID=A0A1H0C3V6_9BACI|nr:glutamate synthase large subunit [Tenuibacillus multivorans]GEL77756.1 glutamate synthase [NADPH] large chain [Tenuibacillus multivorans]SDN52539.1 glutamate synthase (NADPH/NADH) large chain [Tenuibacillus multivorans]
MIQTGLPEKHGLYDPKFESDACGIGFIASIDGEKTHQMIQDAITILCRLEHRGGRGSDPNTGDGAGIMMQIPDELYRKEWNSKLPEQGEYAVGMLFLPQEERLRKLAESVVEQVIEAEQHDLIGWRTVPVDDSMLSETAKSTMPYIRQVFIKKPQNTYIEEKFKQSLYLIRRIIEKRVANMEELKKGPFYFASLSPGTIVYKGMLTPEQMDQFYLDLNNPIAKTAFGMVHSRYSTNTFPSWERAHPNRMLMHNGEINTITGNVNWMKARETAAISHIFEERHEELLPIIDEESSDSGMLDQAFEYLVTNGRSMSQTSMMMVPEAWDLNEQMKDPERACFEYLSTIMEPWDGPTAIAYTDGKQIGASLDRNGLRPARYYITEDNRMVLSSEVGVVDIEPEQVVQKGRLAPGEMILVDLEKHDVLFNEDIKRDIATKFPYREWLNESLIQLKGFQDHDASEELSDYELLQFQLANGYTKEELMKNILPMVTEQKDPIGSMGNDTPLAVLSEQPQLLFNYFKQLFAQVTNPPIDAIREKGVTSTTSYLGPRHNFLDDGPEHCRRIRLYTPILTKQEFDAVVHNSRSDFRFERVSTTYPISRGAAGMESALESMFKQVETAIEQGVSMIVLTDRDTSSERVAIPSLLAVSGLHHYLVRKGLRTKASLILETAEARDVHQFSVLIGFGVDMIYPYLAYRSIEKLVADQFVEDYRYEKAIERYREAATNGIVKVMSKMGISTIQSYRGAQTFEAIGIDHEVMDQYFYGTSSKLSGIGLESIAEESITRHLLAYGERRTTLPSGGAMQWRSDGEHHSFNPRTIHTLQHAARMNSKPLYEKFSELVESEKVTYLRDLLDFKLDESKAIPIDEVEPVEDIWKRFKTGAMSYGALSQEAHEMLAIAMNRIGGKSNSGEGGEDPNRFTPDENGDLRRSAIKQVASGRFGVTSYYLTNADEVQIKMAQGAKPGEGGHLPGKKVHPWIADVRKSTPGVGLISPPPHHDIYSIEDLAQLIYDLKHANPDARLNVKLVAKSGVGTIAAGVAKGRADVILISGYEGGTGASPKTSIRHAGLPWELGLAEAHQTLVLNGLRERVRLETDGKLMTGRDVIKAALLGAEEYGFSTAPMVVLGCILMRACHLDTCPVGIATQDPELRKKFAGNADHVVNYMRFVAEEMREIMAQLGVRTLDELIGRTDFLTVNHKKAEHTKAKQLDLEPLLMTADVGWLENERPDLNVYDDHHMDTTELIPKLDRALENSELVQLDLPIENTNRTVGTTLGYEVSKRYGEEGLREDTIDLRFTGSAGQSFGAYVPHGVTMHVNGDGNDYVGKGLSGGKLIFQPNLPPALHRMEEVIIGNVALFGATSGEAYINGGAGERFAVRNSGARAVVEGVGDNGCEYMTGGRVIVLGGIGKNFAAGMSGGIAYIWANDIQDVKKKCNKELVLFEALEDSDEMSELKDMLLKHVQYTGSKRAKYILNHWDTAVHQFVKIIPEEFKAMLSKESQENQEKVVQ